MTSKQCIVMLAYVALLLNVTGAYADDAAVASSLSDKCNTIYSPDSDGKYSLRKVELWAFKTPGDSVVDYMLLASVNPTPSVADMSIVVPKSSEIWWAAPAQNFNDFITAGIKEPPKRQFIPADQGAFERNTSVAIVPILRVGTLLYCLSSKSNHSWTNSKKDLIYETLVGTTPNSPVFGAMRVWWSTK